uniref:Uncharacterized protein n=1 Tax=Aeromonas hydrophila TaxID=644 RepID=Q6TFA3_AERHY|nr:unknown [Aeromonas hydrophila]
MICLCRRDRLERFLAGQDILPMSQYHIDDELILFYLACLESGHLLVFHSDAKGCCYHLQSI